jgi:hypothetical protein
VNSLEKVFLFNLSEDISASCLIPSLRPAIHIFSEPQPSTRGKLCRSFYHDRVEISEIIHRTHLSPSFLTMFVTDTKRDPHFVLGLLQTRFCFLAIMEVFTHFSQSEVSKALLFASSLIQGNSSVRRYGDHYRCTFIVIYMTNPAM